MTTLATESWTGTNGAAWPTQWTSGSNQGSATIQSNAGRMLADGTGYRRVQRFLNVPVATKCEVYVEVTIAALTEHYPWIFVRADSSRTDEAYPLGYGVALDPAAGVFTTELGYGTGTSLAQNTSLTFTAGGKIGVRVAADGSTFMSKAWPLTGTEPAAWAQTIVDPDNAFPSGRVELAYLSGSGANPGTTFDNLVYTDGQSTVRPGMFFGF